MRVWIPVGGWGFSMVLGCAGLDGLMAPVGSDGVPVVIPEDPDDPEPMVPEPRIPIRAAPATSAFTQAPGWIGYGVRPDGAAQFWIPASGGQVVVWNADLWADVAPDATFVGITQTGPVDLTFTGVGEVPLCGTPRPAAQFSSPIPVAGPVWIVTEAPPGRASGPKDARDPTQTRRLFKVAGGAEVDIQRTGGSGYTAVEWGGGRPWFAAFDAAGADLTKGMAPGALWPELVLSHDQDLSLLFRIHGDDTLAWEWVRIARRKGESLGKAEIPTPGCL